jgi:hypothetical protein
MVGAVATVTPGAYRGALAATSDPGTPTGATPTAKGPAGPLGLAGMLALVPANVPQNSIIASYGNIAAQLETMGLPTLKPTDANAAEIWATALPMIQLRSLIFTNALNPQWSQLFGFNALQVDEGIELGEPPDTFSILRGRFDQSAIAAALTHSGYQKIATAGKDVYSLHKDDSFDFSSPVSVLALNTMNNVGILSDDTIVVAATLDLVNSIIGGPHDASASLAKQNDVTQVLAAVPADLQTAVLVQGSSLGSGGGATPTANPSPASGSALPAIKLALFAATVGGPLLNQAAITTPIPVTANAPTAEGAIALLFGDGADAVAAAQVIGNRFASGTSELTKEPYDSYFSDATVTATPDSPLVTMNLGPSQGGSVAVLFQMLYQRDLGFLAWP